MLQHTFQACHAIHQHCWLQNSQIESWPTAKNLFHLLIMMSKSLQEKEIAGLQYLGGYVLQNLHKKHRASKNWKSTESQQAMSLLTACKEESSNINQSQKLIAWVTRGGLWNPTKKAQKIVLRAEHYFRNNTTPGQCERFINMNVMIEKCCKDTEVVA